MAYDLESAMTALVARVLELATQDADLRHQLRRLAQSFLESTEKFAADSSTVAESAAASTISVAEQAQAVIHSLEADIAAEAPSEQAAPLPELTLGRSLPAAEPARLVYPFQPAAVDFGLIESRCRLKAEAARWAASRRRLMSDGKNFYVEVEPKDRDIIARAKAIPNCFLWMCHPSGPSPADLSLYETVAGCCDTIAEAVSLIKQLQDESEVDPSEFERALDLLAEAQSALRVAIAAMDGPIDSDQMEVHRWLKSTANERQIFIQRYMRVDDPADPIQWPDLLARIEDAEARVHEAQRRRSQRKKLFGKVRHKTSLILNDPAGAASEWSTLISAACELVRGGLPPSSRDLRDLLIPVIELLPEQEVPSDFERVLREIDRFLATCPPLESAPAARSSPEVLDAAKLLRGRTLVMIGGERRAGAYQALKDSLSLRELIWIETRAHESIDGFESYVARPDVAAVLLAIRWSSHSYGDVRDFCEKHGKPLVRLPGGYNPNQVAAQILTQCSERLRTANGI